MKKILPLLALTVNVNCCLEPAANPIEPMVPVYQVGKEEAPGCTSEAKKCTYYSGLSFGVVSMYKCSTEDWYKIYTKEQNKYGNILQYETKLSEDLSDKQFSQWCKNSFLNYKQFREDTDGC